MIYHTQFLKTIMVFVILCLPIGLGVNLSYFISLAVKKKKLCLNYLGMIVSYSVILLISFLSGIGRPLDTGFEFHVIGILIAVLSGFMCICVEYIVGVLLNYFQTGQWVQKFSIHSVYSDAGKLDIWDILAVGIFVILEELIFRSAIINVLLDLSLPATFIICIAVIIFALNHIHWGLFTAVQKLFSGCIFVLLYVLSGYNLLLPVIAHLVQNFTLLMLSRRTKNE